MRRLAEGVTRPEPVEIDVDGRTVVAYPGESLAAALLAADVHGFRRSRTGTPRGPFCNMGVCFECVVEVDGTGGVRACMTPVRAGLRVRTGADGRG